MSLSYTDVQLDKLTVNRFETLRDFRAAASAIGENDISIIDEVFQVDWDDSDSGSSAYIKNRTHYRQQDFVEKHVTNACTVNIQNGIMRINCSGSSVSFFFDDNTPTGTLKSFSVNVNGQLSVTCQPSRPYYYQYADGNAGVNDVYNGWGSSNSLEEGDYYLLRMYDNEQVDMSIVFYCRVADIGETLNSFDITWIDWVYSKLDNRYLNVAPVAITGSYNDLTDKPEPTYEGTAHTGTTEYWHSQSGYVPADGEIVVYTDKASKIVSGQTIDIPGVKIGTGNAYVQDLAFVGQDTADSLLAHISDTSIHVTAADREKWDNKLNVSDESGVVEGCLILTRD